MYVVSRVWRRNMRSATICWRVAFNVPVGGWTMVLYSVVAFLEQTLQRHHLLHYISANLAFSATTC